MDEKPRFELPQRMVTQRPIFDRRSAFFSFGVLVLFGVLVALQFRKPDSAEPTRSAGTGWTADQQKALAMRLEDRNLHSAAAEAWTRYLLIATLEPAAAAAVHYRIGKLQQDAEQYQAAISSYYQAEAMLGDAKGDLAHEINVRVRDCYTKLGQYGDLDRDLAERTAPTGDKPAGLAGQQIVAEIGAEKLTITDFDRMIQQEIDVALKAMPGLTPEQMDDARRRYLQQYSSSQARTRKLQELVAVKVLARKARADGLDKSAAFRKRIVEMSDMLLANGLLSEEISRRATVTPDDCKRYYEANKALYVQPAQARIAHILCPSQEPADQIIAKLKAGAQFEELARQSADAATKDKGGAIEQPVLASGKYIPGIGENADLHEAIFKATAGALLERAFKGDRGYHVVKVLERSPSRQLGQDEVADRIRSDTQRARAQEVTEQYIQALFEEAKVKLYPEAFGPLTTAPAATGASAAAKGKTTP